MATMTKQYTVSAVSPKYGEATVTLTLEFNNENNTSVITVCEGFVMGGQTSGYTAEGMATATNKANGNSIRLYSLKALTKLGTNHLYIYKADEAEQNKQTRFICELTYIALTIKNDIYNWRKSLSNE
ncbi:MAG: hypothetical protein IIV72_08340 [Alistipes sp.]|nr:hypothetical protein [Alistipes sp.]